MENLRKLYRIMIIFSIAIFPTFVFADEVEVETSCNGIFTPEALDLIKEILRYFAILGPVVLIIMIAVDLVRGVGSNNQDEIGKSTGRIVKRIIATICLFIAPLITAILLNLPGINDYLKETGIVDDPLCGASIGTSEFSASTKLSITKYTKDSVKVTVTVEKGQAKYAVGSDGKRYNLENNRFTFTAEKNGSYDFTFYNEKDEQVMTKKVTIKNIVTEKPNGKCIIMEKTIYVSATSLAGIYGYSYSLGGEYSNYTKENRYIADNYIIKASVNVQDNAGNIQNITCENGGMTGQIPATGKIIWAAESDSLKVNVEEKDDYIAARIWAANPYQQLKTYTSTDYKETYDSIKDIMDRTVKNNKLQNKITIATNDLISNTYGAYTCTTRKYPIYTCMTLVLKNGQIMYEDATNGNVSEIPFGLTLSGELKAYPFRRGTTSKKIEARRKLIAQAKADGLKDTHTAHNILILNGEVKGRDFAPLYKSTWDDNTTDIRTGICQVDNNNFIIFISKHSQNVTELTKIMKGYNCINGYNMDGGGSTTFKVKNQTEDTLHRVEKVGTDGGRGRMWGILYFTEL